jgi:hypothetical protein
LFLLLAAALGVPPLPPIAQPRKTPTAVKLPWEATAAYEQRQIMGWKVLVNRNFLANNRGLADRVLVHLQDHLYRITHRLPPKAVAKLKQIPIWVEENHPKHPCMCYHVSTDWLRNNSMNPEKAKAVEIANGVNFLEWTKTQPWMVLHELAHGYHDRFLPNGYDNKEVRDAYNAAMKQKLYESVLDSAGGKRRHYACNNQMEYFAEATEAYFGANDYYPFVRPELKLHDPVGYSMIGKIWNE